MGYSNRNTGCHRKLLDIAEKYRNQGNDESAVDSVAERRTWPVEERLKHARKRYNYAHHRRHRVRHAKIANAVRGN